MELSACLTTLAPSPWVILHHKYIQIKINAVDRKNLTPNLIKNSAHPRPGLVVPTLCAPGLTTLAQGCKPLGAQGWRHKTRAKMHLPIKVSQRAISHDRDGRAHCLGSCKHVLIQAKIKPTFCESYGNLQPMPKIWDFTSGFTRLRACSHEEKYGLFNLLHFRVNWPYPRAVASCMRSPTTLYWQPFAQGCTKQNKN